MALRARKVSGAFEKRDQLVEIREKVISFRLSHRRNLCFLVYNFDKNGSKLQNNSLLRNILLRVVGMASYPASRGDWESVDQKILH